MAELIKVSAQSRSTAVAGAIAGVMREHGYAEIQAIGASAINQAIKAITIARGYLEQDNWTCRSCRVSRKWRLTATSALRSGWPF